MGSTAQLKSVRFGKSTLAVIPESLLLTDAQLINNISTVHCIAQEICLVYATNFTACMQDLCASLQYELSQHTGSCSQHIDELTLQLENANQELSQHIASHSQHVDELHIQLENVNKELSLLQVSQYYQKHLPSLFLLPPSPAFLSLQFLCQGGTQVLRLRRPHCHQSACCLALLCCSTSFSTVCILQHECSLKLGTKIHWDAGFCRAQGLPSGSAYKLT